METKWPLQDAKNRLSRIVYLATHEGPQIITLRGEDAVVVLSMAEFRRLAQPDESLVEFFQRSPLLGVDLDLERSKDPGRAVDL